MPSNTDVSPLTNWEMGYNTCRLELSEQPVVHTVTGNPLMVLTAAWVLIKVLCAGVATLIPGDGCVDTCGAFQCESLSTSLHRGHRPWSGTCLS